MSGPDFLDTNVLVYAYDVTDPAKQSIAQDLVRKAVVGGLVISPQVLAEFAATLLHKLVPPPSSEDVIALLDTLAPIRLVPPDHDTIRRAVEARAAYGLQFYDGMIVAAAERAGCERIWSEDFNPGQKYFGVVAANPFQGSS
jgi:predicted nucleic acid-binding protein